MTLGREVEKDIKRIADSLERQAQASEQLNELAKSETLEEQQIIAPGFCPHCATINPVIRNEGGSDKFNNFILAAGCDQCGKLLYAVPNGWTIFPTPNEARQLIEERTA